MKRLLAKLKDRWGRLPAWIRQLAGFGVVGTINIAVQYGLYYFLLAIQLIPGEFYYTLCNLVSIFATWVVSYILYSKFVFKPRKVSDQPEDQPLKTQFAPRRTLRMIITNASYLILSSTLIVFFVQTCNVSERIASLVCITVLIPYNFLLTKLWVYKDVKND